MDLISPANNSEHIDTGGPGTKLGLVPHLTKLVEGLYICIHNICKALVQCLEHSSCSKIANYEDADVYSKRCTAVIPVARLPGFALCLCYVSLDKLHTLSVVQLRDL